MSTTLQMIKNTSGKPEYVLLPIEIYRHIKDNIDLCCAQCVAQDDYVDFKPTDFIKNKIALARMQAKITQTMLAKHLRVSQAYISKIENDNYKVSMQLFKKINAAIKKISQSR